MSLVAARSDRWQHTEQWNSASSLGLSKHQTVQALEAAVILSNPEALGLLPDDRSHWPAAVSPATSGLLGSERLNIDVLRSTGSVYSKSMPVQRSRLSGMLAEEDIEEETGSIADTNGESAVVHDIDDASTDSADSDFGMDGDEDRGLREDTELAGMDQEMFSLDLHSASGSQAGTPVSRTVPLPDRIQPSGLTYMGQNGQQSRFDYTHGSSFTSGVLQTIPSQVSMTAFAAKAQASKPPYAGYNGSIRRAAANFQSHTQSSAGRRGGREGSLAPSSSGQTSSSASSHSDREVNDGLYQKPQATLSKPAQLTPMSASSSSSPGIPNLSISAPVLGFFTEQHPPSASVVSPHLGPTKMTSPALRATRSPHLAPVPAGSAGIDVPPLDGIALGGEGYASLEAAAAEVLSTSHKSHAAQLAGEQQQQQLPASHGRSLSNGRASFAALSSSPYARSPFERERPSLSAGPGSLSQTRSFSSSAREVPNNTQQVAGSNSIYGTSFGQAPLVSSFRSASYKSPPPAAGPQLPETRGNHRKSSSPEEAEEPLRNGEDDDEIMDMDL